MTIRLLDPLVFGDYPAEMHSILGSQLPKFSPEEKSLLRGSLDFFGINHYGALYVKDCSLSNCSLEASRPIKGFVETTGMRDGIPIGDQVPICSPDALIMVISIDIIFGIISFILNRQECHDSLWFQGPWRVL